MDLAQVFPVGLPPLGADEVRTDPRAVPAASGVYGWWFDEVPPGVPTAACVQRDEWTLMYVGISPKAPPRNGAPPSRQTLRSRIRYHFRGNAAGSTLRLTLGVLLAEELGIELRRVGSGARRTFASGERTLSEWMAAHGRVTVFEHPTPWTVEEELIATLDLPLNLDQNRHHTFHSVLSERRRQAKAVAESLPVVTR